MATTEQIEQAKRAKESLQAMAKGTDDFRLRLAYVNAATLLGVAIAAASGARNEEVARGLLAGGIGPAAAGLKAFKASHPEYEDEIGQMPEQLASIGFCALEAV